MSFMKKMLYTISLVCILSVIVFGTFSKEDALASMPIQVAVDGVIMNPGEQPPFIRNDRVMIPLRVLADAVDVGIHWDMTTGATRINTGSRIVEVWPDSHFVRINGVTRYIDTAPVLSNNYRISIPLNFINEALGYYTAWDGTNFIVSIFTQNQTSQERIDIVLGLASIRDIQQTQTNLDRINIGDTTHQVEHIMGRPNRTEIGFMGMETWTYHHNYHDLYLFGFHNGRLMYIYTSSESESVLGIAVGDTWDSVGENVITRNFTPLELFGGNLIAYLDNNPARSNRIHTIAGNNIVIYHLDELDGGRVAGIEIYHSNLAIGNTQVVDHRYIFFGNRPQLGLPTPPPGVQPVINQSLARQVFDITNAMRVQQGLAPLTWHSGAAGVAYAHSRDMSNRNFFDHTCPSGNNHIDRLTAADIAFRNANENLAMNTVNSAGTVHALMNSGGHRAVILQGNMTHLGVGAFQGRNMYYTQVFLQTN